MSTFSLIHCDFCPIWLVFDIKQFDEGWDIVTLTCLTSLPLRKVRTPIPLLSEMYSHSLPSPRKCTHISSLPFKNVLTSYPLPSEMYSHPLTSSQKSTFIPSGMYSHPLPSLRSVLISPPFPSEIYILSPSLRNVLTSSSLHLEMYSHPLPCTLFNLFWPTKTFVVMVTTVFFSPLFNMIMIMIIIIFFLRRNHIRNHK